MTIEESDNPGGTFQFKDDTAISIQVSSKGSISVSGKLCTYPSPNPAFYNK